jgi:AraC family transcriptional regulator
LQRSWPGFSLESVRIRESRAFDYDWLGDRHYLAVHHIVLRDGEVAVDGVGCARKADLRDKLTFVPPHARVSGWSDLAGDDHGYAALFFDPHLAEAEYERPLLGGAVRPLLYFENAPLCRTLWRLETLLTANPDPDPLVAETLGLYAVLQLQPLLDVHFEHAAGKLSLLQQSRIADFVQAHLSAPVSLTDLAAVAGLSRYHFARSFTRTYGRSPHQYVLSRRITEAACLLADSRLPVGEIAPRVGFSSPARLSIAFRRIFGVSPRAFRQSVRQVQVLA